SAGRTTMCPTELFYDHTEKKPYIRMLPIETRLEETCIAEYKQNRDYWTCMELDIESPDSLVETFQEIARSLRLS
ncbi:MAG: GTPase, partial [candidate division Zixibacteria bacterium]